MKFIESKELKQIQLDILDDFTSFCESNGLRYFLGYGTLLGAIRHKGFIPWDDDIDLMMPRPDYEKFLSLYNERGGIYKVIHSKSENGFFTHFAKVHDPRTRYQEGYSVESNFGVFIDIFPLDGYKNDFQRNICLGLFKLLHYKSLVTRKDNSTLKNLCIKALKIVLSPLSSKTISNGIVCISKQNDYETSNKVVVGVDVLEPFERSWLEQFLLMPFEEKLYRVPKEYDAVLKNLYGNYMKLPPVEKRINLHNAKVWWI